MAAASSEDVFNIAPLLHPDVARSGVRVERWRLQAGKLPEDANDANPATMVALWSSNVTGIPALKVPEGAESDVMGLSDKLQMRGGGPVIFAREEVAHLQHLPNTLLNVVGAANNANKERIETALSYVEAHGLEEQPIVATVDPRRVLSSKERETVAGFAPEATNELELFVDSAIVKGFEPLSGNRYGVRFLPDGSAFLRMRHPSGASMVVLATTPALRSDGSKQTGVFNAYQALVNNPGVVGDEFGLAGSNIIHVTSTHYGTMAVMNNLRAVDDLRESIGSFRVIGDNQAARTAQAHLIEVGLTVSVLQEAMSNPRIADSLRRHLEIST